MTSAPISSCNHLTATDVSRPPLYANTMRFATLTPRCFWMDYSETAEGPNTFGDLVSASSLLGDDKQRVISSDGAEHAGKPCAVECRCDNVCRAGRGAQHDQVGRVGDVDDPVGQDPTELFFRHHPVLGQLRDCIDRVTAGDADFDGPDVLEIAAYRRLGGSDTTGREQFDEVRL